MILFLALFIHSRRSSNLIAELSTKSENVMSEEKSKERTYSDAEVKALLEAELPHWYLEDGWIRRKYRTHGWKGTLMVINTVGHLAEAAWHPPDITASYAWV